ncbi:MAG TPA: DUF4215 domain-containing protein, partial [Polyangiaceae bacterium]|nr:DUF4215 domain-containing protein [Polyangiaceae bacterium]
MAFHHRLFALTVLTSTWLPLACTPAGDGDGNDSPSDDPGDTDDGGTPDSDVGDGTDFGTDDDGVCTTCEAICGDGLLAEEEVCDDANTTGGDGCSADCSAVEAGFLCRVPGEACRAFVRCGDGVVTFPEQCDDGNPDPNDGCSARCKIEPNTKCSGSPSVCTPTVCGDGQASGALGTPEGTEGCDFGDTVPFDGCSETCQVEPSCDGKNGCSSLCGDGIVLGEDCDDGNTLDGDGCSSSCQVEVGSICEQPACEGVGGDCILRIPAVFIDHSQAHPDFQINCEDGNRANIVQSELGADGLPVLGSNMTCHRPTQLANWFVHVAGVNSQPIVGELLLFANGAGGYVNRWQNDGTRIATLDASHAEVDGQPFFFPLDDKGITPRTASETTDDVNSTTDGYHDATVNVTYSGLTTPLWSQESSWRPTATTAQLLHNFHFTSRVKHWFRYDASKTATLAFTGDDDVWVFINGTRALDLGGLHAPMSGTVQISSATAGTYQLQDGKVYP